MALPPLASVDDITGRLGRLLTDVEQQRVTYLLLDASVQIRRYCRKDFLYHANEVRLLRGDGATIRLPYRPVISVSSVIAISGRSDIPDIPVSWWTFDGVDEISLAEATASGVINLPEAWYEFGAYPGTYRVTYTHGYQAYPDEVNSVCANAVIAVLLAPTMAAGVIGESVGAYSYRLERSGGGSSVALAAADLGMLSDFRDDVSDFKLEA